jgi:peptide/nickel transport system permease protein
MAAMDLMLALPAILLAITIAARLGPGLTSAMIAAGLVGLPNYARLARGSALVVKRREFVDAATALGASRSRIMLRHILPNLATPLIIFTTFEFARLLLVESALSFLGLGVQPPLPSWGAMIADGRQNVFEAWWASALPGAAIVLAVLAFNFLGDGLRDALDPASEGD